MHLLFGLLCSSIGRGNLKQSVFYLNRLSVAFPLANTLTLAAWGDSYILNMTNQCFCTKEYNTHSQSIKINLVCYNYICILVHIHKRERERYKCVHDNGMRSKAVHKTIRLRNFTSYKPHILHKIRHQVSLLWSWEPPFKSLKQNAN